MFTGTWRSIALFAVETCLLIGAVVASSFLRLGAGTQATLVTPDGILKVALVVLVCQACLHYEDLYDLRTITGTNDLLVRLFQALGATSLVLAAIYYWFPTWVIGRGVFIISAGLAISLVMVWRFAFRWLALWAPPRERLLLVGTSSASVALARELFERRQELGVEIVGFVDPDPNRIGAPVLNPGVVGALSDIPALIGQLNVGRVVVGLADARGKLPMDQLLQIRLENNVIFDDLASVYEEYTGKIAVENLRPSWFVFSNGFRKGALLMASKRAFDVVAATVGLILSAPVMLLVALAVRLESRGPILYKQERVGFRGKVFMVHKFRTMKQDAEASTGPVWSQLNDERVTKVGGFLRRARLDELPQLWNVLNGEMSFVGPRPERPSFVEQLTASIPFYGRRHVVKPGLTGWAQIRYTYGATVEDAVEKLQYDLYYIKHLSIAFDCLIVLETVKTVLLRRGAR